MCLQRTRVIPSLHITAARCKYCLLYSTMPLCDASARYAASSSFLAEFAVQCTLYADFGTAVSIYLGCHRRLPA